MIIQILILGFVFGTLLRLAKLNRFDTINGMAIMEDFKVAKAILLTIGLGAILLAISIGLGYAEFHAKPLLVGGIVVGGLVFGGGMALLGYCPGTLMVSLGEGSLDAAVGLLGAMAGGLLYTMLQPTLSPLLGPDWGIITLNSVTAENPYLYFTLVILLGFLFTAIAFFLHKREKSHDLTWIYAGIGLALLTNYLFLKSGMNRLLGASSAYPYLADLIAGYTSNDYFAKIAKSGSWELLFLGGSLMAGLVNQFQNGFKTTLIHDNWARFHGNNAGKRILWALIGGFLLIFGARMAGGCTSGHIISGGMQLALSSLLFGCFAFTGLLITGRLFYKAK